MPRDPQASLFDREGVIGRLEASLATLEWGIAMIPDGWTHRSPSGTKMSAEEGAWSAAMNLAHLALYTERAPVPVLRSLLSGGDGITGAGLREPTALEPAAQALAQSPLDEILERLRVARNEEVNLARSFTPEAWVTPATRAWGQGGYGPPLHSPARVVSKSFQHTWEHGNAVLRIALFAPMDLLPD